MSRNDKIIKIKLSYPNEYEENIKKYISEVELSKADLCYMLRKTMNLNENFEISEISIIVDKN